MTRILISGAAGFIASHLVAYLRRERPDWQIVCLDRLDEAASLSRLGPFAKDVKFLWHDLRAPIRPEALDYGDLRQPFDYIAHLAAASHVTRSVKDPMGFIADNVIGTANMLEYARAYTPKKLLYFSCYDTETRALTTDGLKRYDELKEGDVVFGMGPDGKLVEQPVERVIVQDYEGEMVHFRSHRTDLLVTPNHRMYGSVRKSGSTDVIVEEADVTADRMHLSALTLPRPLPWLGSSPSALNVPGVGDVDAGTLAYLCGLFIGDGFVADQIKVVPSKSGLSKAERLVSARDATTGRLISTQKQPGSRDTVSCVSYRIFFDIPTKDPARARLTDALSALGVKYSEHAGKAGEHVYVGSGAWSDFFRQFGKGARNKRIPRWLLGLDAPLLRRLYDGLIDSDGYWQTTAQYTTVSPGLVSDLCELAFKLGMSPKVDTHPPGEQQFRGRTIRGGASYYVYFSSETMPLLSRRTATRKAYNGKIWCVTVPTKNLVVERHGRLAICGNTDEVFGPAPEGVSFDEYSQHAPTNPYAATKAAAEVLCTAWASTYDVPIVVSHGTNFFGEGQYREKFIPMCVESILEGRVIQIHSRDGEPSARYYTHAENAASAIVTILEKGGIIGGPLSGKYNISGDVELSNLDVAQRIAASLGKPLKYELVEFVPDRPKHDQRYAIKSSRLEDLGWAPHVSFQEGLRRVLCSA